MQIATAWSTEKNTAAAVSEAIDALHKKLDRTPSTLITYYTCDHDAQCISDHLLQYTGHANVHGCTSCRGVMTEEGFHSNDGSALAVWALSDFTSNFGVGIAEISEDPRDSARRAITNALIRADRKGELPSLIWLNSSPGQEEDIIQGIEDVVGSHVPIAGGSAADNQVAGEWNLFAGEKLSNHAIVVTCMFLNTDIAYAFHSGYLPSPTKGRVTKAEGRHLMEIDGRPAALVYNEWTEGAISQHLDSGENILGATTLFPLGRVASLINTVPYFKLSHPDSITPEQGLTLFSEIYTDDEITLMMGTEESLVSRAGRVAQSALDSQELTTEQIVGGLYIYCGGCMLAVQEHMPQVVESIRSTLQDIPFIGAFTFGEQGCFTGGHNSHGNLMISTVMFEH